MAILNYGEYYDKNNERIRRSELVKKIESERTKSFDALKKDWKKKDKKR